MAQAAPCASEGVGAGDLLGSAAGCTGSARKSPSLEAALHALACFVEDDAVKREQRLQVSEAVSHLL